jgi:ABC-type sugar transport system ATPase subunit
MNFLPGRVSRVDGGSLDVEVAGELLRVARTSATRASPAVGDTVTVGIRPERLSLAASSSAGKRAESPSPSRGESSNLLTLHGEVTLLERLGSEALAHVHLRGEPSETIVAKLAGDAPLSPGAALTLEVQPSACHLFDSSGNASGTHA